MAGLAADADLGPGGGEAIVRRIVVLAHAGRVALGAHEVPVLVQLGPVQDIVVADLLVGIEVEPALAALVLRPAVPGDRQRLQAAIRELDQVLLQRIDAEGVFDLERGELAVGAVGLDEELAVLAEKAGAHAVVVEARIVEVAQHRFARWHAASRACAASCATAPPRRGGSRRTPRCRRRQPGRRSPRERRRTGRRIGHRSERETPAPQRARPPPRPRLQARAWMSAIRQGLRCPARPRSAPSAIGGPRAICVCCASLSSVLARDVARVRPR